MNLSERITAAEEKLVQTKDSLVEATTNLEAAPDEESLLVEVETLTGEVEKATASINALKKAEAALAARAKPIEGVPNIAPDLAKHAAEDRRKKEPGDLLFKHATAALVAHVRGERGANGIRRVIEDIYKDTPAVMESFDHLQMRKQMVQKTAVNPADTMTTGWAAELVQTDVRGFLASLEDVSVAAALAAQAMSLDFEGYNSITIPTENATAKTPTEPAWVAEGRPIPLTQFGYGSATIDRYKLAAITTATKEIVERSSPQIEGLLRNGLRKNYAKVLDNALLDSGGMVQYVRPAGLLNGVTALGPKAGGGDDAVREDILTLVKAMTAAKLGSKPVLLVNNLDRLAVSMMVSAMSEYLFRDELSSGQLLGIPVIASANVAQHTVILVDADALTTAFDVPEFDVSEVATVMEADASLPTFPPSMVTDQAGGNGSNAGQVGTDEGIMVAGTALTGAAANVTGRSLWQTYSLGIRMVAPTSWKVLRAGAVQLIDTSTWTT